MNFFSFHMVEKIFVSPSFMEDIFPEYRIPDCQESSFVYLKGTLACAGVCCLCRAACICPSVPSHWVPSLPLSCCSEVFIIGFKQFDFSAPRCGFQVSFK